MPDGLFFTRVVVISAGATAADAAAQIELALEAASPFPLSQLYHGWFWTPGAEQAVVFAAYRRRFTSEQMAAWADAELVMPACAALFGATVEPATTIVLAAADGLTAVHWETPGVPSRVVFKPLDPEATDDDRARVREELLRAMGGSKVVLDLPAPPAADPAQSDREVVFRSGDFVSRLPAPVASALDVRDKADLAALRAARHRDVVLWRVALGCAAALLLLGLAEIGVIAGGSWQNTRIAVQKARAPLVEKIKASQSLANLIDDLVNKRLLPLEMVTTLVGLDNKWKPDDITITRVDTSPNTDEIYTLLLEVQTANGSLINVYESQIRKLPECEDVKVTAKPSPGNRLTFSVVVTFKPGAIKAATHV
ncbi:MAG TPA: hypothetical protein VHD34_05900 [Xanthobacteraceae bacterium]|nr:hypothetical protein [Xanthobacteraceae bacterium]